MPITTKLHVSSKPRAILKPGGNIVPVHQETTKHNKKKTQGPRKQVTEISDSDVIVGSNVCLDLDSTCSSDSTVKKVNSANGNGNSKVKRNGFKPLPVTDAAHVSPPCKGEPPSKTCDWITPNSGKSLCVNIQTLTIKINFIFTGILNYVFIFCYSIT